MWVGCSTARPNISEAHAYCRTLHANPRLNPGQAMQPVCDRSVSLAVSAFISDWASQFQLVMWLVIVSQLEPRWQDSPGGGLLACKNCARGKHSVGPVRRQSFSLILSPYSGPPPPLPPSVVMVQLYTFAGCFNSLLSTRGGERLQRWPFQCKIQLGCLYTICGRRWRLKYS